MQNLANFNDNNHEKFPESIFSHAERPFIEFPPLRQLSSFYCLQIITFQSKNIQKQCIVTNLSPDNMGYYIFPKKQKSIFVSALHSHQHDFHEILFVLEGKFCHSIENESKTYTKGDICILNKNIRHSVHSYSDTDFQIAVLQISDTYMKTLFCDLSTKMFVIEREHKTSVIEHFFNTYINDDFSLQKAYLNLTPFDNRIHIIDSIYNLLDEIAKETLFPEVGSSYFIKDKIIRLFLLVSMENNYHALPVQVNSTNESIIFNQITKIMEKSFGRTTRKELEDTLHYSGIYLNEITKKFTGLTIFNYGMTFCMKQAALLLIKTDLSVSSIAEELQFTNRTHFYQVFKKTYDMTPTEFRNKYKGLLL